MVNDWYLFLWFPSKKRFEQIVSLVLKKLSYWLYISFEAATLPTSEADIEVDPWMRGGFFPNLQLYQTLEVQLDSFAPSKGSMENRGPFLRSLQVILFVIDYAIFYTNLHELFCQFISWTNWVNSGKFMDNCWILCEVTADKKKV